tara:strand:- start:1562 stop:1708 length:147 start_codon:yes stop_codon:yes gene_type:complete
MVVEKRSPEVSSIRSPKMVNIVAVVIKSPGFYGPWGKLKKPGTIRLVY